MKVVISNSAYRDLEEIWHYTFMAWSAEQADEYIDDIQSAIDQLVINSRLGMRCDEILPGYFKLFVKHHYIFYRLNSSIGELQIVRVLHESMNINQNLKGGR